MTDHGQQRKDGYVVPTRRHESASAECNRLRDELARLRANNKRLRSALEYVKLFWDNKCCEYAGPGWYEITVHEEYVEKLKLAADALRGNGGEES